MIDDDFECDDAKNATNYAKHGVWFARARLVFADPFAAAEFDDRENDGEDRFTITGIVEGTLLLTARRATKHEQDDDYTQNGQAP